MDPRLPSEPVPRDSLPRPDIASLDLAGIAVQRTRHDGSSTEKAPETPVCDAFGIIVQLRRFDHHKLWRERQLYFEGGHDAATLSITDMRLRWQCHHLSTFDNVRFLVPFASLRRFVDGVGRRDFNGLLPQQGTCDQVMLGLCQALLPALENPQDAHPLFLEQMKLAIFTHLVQEYGELSFSSQAKGSLAGWQEKRVIDYIVEHLDEPFSISSLAEACGLSRSYFIKAFQRSFGRTPHQWLTEYRVKRARELLQMSMPISEIALACGFSDQSHFTRVFSKLVGTSPARYRQSTKR
ncbi:AraC family transcriptional regulator [Breoghania corrubedonensis]|uniref:AraC family transcriptional regulator n=1 Tax=Breoghania corrubedonensis TaxID=665038 RepID=A0A2T5UW24_9HYPH|nr:helix-turn-helix domain-containing protein [Breoghania corrubedonensis]PTW55698.1 AraC family transcriptional regulator [Breoghania corrubedonensis]